jgi:hypothetical protein
VRNTHSIGARIRTVISTCSAAVTRASRSTRPRVQRTTRRGTPDRDRIIAGAIIRRGALRANPLLVSQLALRAIPTLNPRLNPRLTPPLSRRLAQRFAQGLNPQFTRGFRPRLSHQVIPRATLKFTLSLILRATLQFSPGTTPGTVPPAVPTLNPRTVGSATFGAPLAFRLRRILLKYNMLGGQYRFDDRRRR